jgi:chorismate mutase / prephenate dehydratase
VGQVKRDNHRAMHDPEREQQIYARLDQRLDAKKERVFPKSAVRPVFREVISACLSIEQKISVAFLGPTGTFSHMAARSAFGMAARYVEASTIPGVFDAVSRSAATFGIVPIENSTEGGVTFTLDSLIDTDLRIRNEVVLDVALCLVGRHDDLNRIERVYSHPQALAQCRTWLGKNLPRAQLVVSPSTSAAARETLTDETAAAVTSRLAAELNGLAVIRDNIQDRAQNATRFVVLAESDAPPTGNDRTTVVFSTPDERGALRRVLDIFDEENINLTRIESRPRPGKLWQYVFFTDLEGHRLDPHVARALERLDAQCEMVKVLGSYPRATGKA